MLDADLAALYRVRTKALFRRSDETLRVFLKTSCFD